MNPSLFIITIMLAHQSITCKASSGSYEPRVLILEESERKEKN